MWLLSDPTMARKTHQMFSTKGTFREDDFNAAMSVLRDAGDNAKSDFMRKGRKGGQQVCLSLSLTCLALFFSKSHFKFFSAHRERALACKSWSSSRSEISFLPSCFHLAKKNVNFTQVKLLEWISIPVSSKSEDVPGTDQIRN